MLWPCELIRLATNIQKFQRVCARMSKPISSDALAIEVFNKIDEMYIHHQHVSGAFNGRSVVPTRISELDQVLGGGAEIGRILLVAGSDDRVAEALAYAVIRRTHASSILVAPDAQKAMRRMLAAASGVREESLESGILSDHDLDRLVFGMVKVARSGNLVFDDSLLDYVHDDVNEIRRLVVVPGGPRWQKPNHWLTSLLGLARNAKCAVLATASQPMDLPEFLVRHESHRVSWRLIPLRGLSYAKEHPLLPGAA